MRILFVSEKEELIDKIIKKLPDDIYINHYPSFGEIKKEEDRFELSVIEISAELEEEIHKNKDIANLLNKYSFLVGIVREKNLNIEDNKLLNFDKIFVLENEDKVIENILEIVKDFREEESSFHKSLLIKKFKEFGIIGTSRTILEVYKNIEKVSPLSVSVLLIGESGTGKELFAKAIHILSPRRDKPFIPIHCGAIPENLLEDELFGHTKGSFTGAINDKPGKFEIADGGTIFLDEISTMSQNLQVKLLRVIQEKEISRIGSNTIKKVDVRIISASNQDLKELVDKGDFREDLFYRLNVFPIIIPPLRRRKEDIPKIANYFIKKFCENEDIEQKQISLSALNILKEYSFPGNIRELENIIIGAIVNAGPRRVILPSDLPSSVKEEAEKSKINNQIEETELDDNFSLQSFVREMEKKLILQSLEKTNWNKKRAAELLRIKRTTLIEKIKKLNINKS